MNTRNLIGQQFGRLVVISKEEGRKNGCLIWKCRCDCGNEVKVPTGSLTMFVGQQEKNKTIIAEFRKD